MYDYLHWLKLMSMSRSIFLPLAVVANCACWTCAIIWVCMPTKNCYADIWTTVVLPVCDMSIACVVVGPAPSTLGCGLSAFGIGVHASTLQDGLNSRRCPWLRIQRTWKAVVERLSSRKSHDIGVVISVALFTRDYHVWCRC